MERLMKTTCNETIVGIPMYSENGNPNQWGESHPDEKTILSDIESGQHFLCADGNGIMGCFALIIGDDPTYETIVKGKWLVDSIARSIE